MASQGSWNTVFPWVDAFLCLRDRKIILLAQIKFLYEHEWIKSYVLITQWLIFAVLNFAGVFFFWNLFLRIKYHPQQMVNLEIIGKHLCDVSFYQMSWLLCFLRKMKNPKSWTNDVLETWCWALNNVQQIWGLVNFRYSHSPKNLPGVFPFGTVLSRKRPEIQCS